MRRSRLLPLALTAVTALAACADAPAAPAPVPSARAGGALVERPWTGRCDVAAAIAGPTQRITGTCRLAHLGRVTVVTEEAFTSPTTAVNTSTYTAANGDSLFTAGTVDATVGPDGVTLTGTWTVVGGTGRFAGASGTAAYAGAARFTGPTTAEGAYTLEGRLAY